MAQGIPTPLVAAGYLLAKLTHAPNATFISAIGQAFCRDWAPLGVATIEKLWIGNGLLTIDFVQAALDLLPRFGPKEFFRPGQVGGCSWQLQQYSHQRQLRESAPAAAR